MPSPIKNPTAWRPTSGQGYVTSPGVSNITDQLGHNITDQLASPITDTGYQVMPKNATTWTQVG